MATCYWNHDSQPSETYLCFDGKSQVCARCCVENCAVETPVWFANCADAGHPTWPAVRTRQNIAPKLVFLESYWNQELFKTISVKGFFESLAMLIRPRLQVAHRFVESERGLAYYTRHPDGLLWKLPESWDTPIYYLAFHGEPGTVKSTLDRIGSETLLEAFRGYGKSGYRNLIYFAACNVLCGSEGQKFARDFLEVSGCRAVIGYTTNVDWMQSLSPTCFSCSASTPIQTPGTVLPLSSLRSKKTTGRRRLWDIHCCKPKASHRHGLIRKHRRRFSDGES